MARARPHRTTGSTRLAALRLQTGRTQRTMAAFTGIPLRTYQRLERGEISNPPLRYLTNCALALQVELEDVIEPEWREWTQFSASASAPPTFIRTTASRTR
jgi:transcriptional regulator with XRE-family HTH domain